MRGWMRRANAIPKPTATKKHTHARTAKKREELSYSVKRTAELKEGKRRRRKEENTNEINNPEIMIYPH